MFFSIMFVFLFCMFFIFLFYNNNGCLPFHYSIDNFVFYKVALSIRNLDFPTPESIGVSPVYPLLISIFDFFVRAKYSLIITDIICLLIFLIFFYKLIEYRFGKNRAFISVLLCGLNPFFLRAVFSGYSEMLSYLFLCVGVYLFILNRVKRSIIFFVFSVLIRPEYLLIFPLLLFRGGNEKKRAAAIFILLLLIFNTFFVNVFTRSHTNPFLSKYGYTFYKLKGYLEAKDKSSYLNKAFFESKEVYSTEKIEEFNSKIKDEKIKYILHSPLIYLMNVLVVIKIFIKNFWFFLISLPIFLFFYKKTIPGIYYFILISPFIFISSQPLHPENIRYFTYLIPVFSFFISYILNKRRFISLLIIIMMCFISLSYLNYYMSDSLHFNRIISFFKENSIKQKNIMTNSSWVAFETGNEWYMPPPFAENKKKFDDYVNENKIDYLVFDPDWKNLDYDFYNNRFLNQLKKDGKYFPILSERIYGIDHEIK